MGTLSREATLSFSCSLPFPVGVNSSRKEFALLRVDPFMKTFVLQGNNQKATEVVLFCKMVGKDNVYTYILQDRNCFFKSSTTLLRKGFLILWHREAISQHPLKKTKLENLGGVPIHIKII